MHASVTVRVLRTRPGLDQVRDRWTQLSTSCQTPFQQFFWTEAAVEAFPSARHLRMVSVDAGTSTAFLPLVRSLNRGPRWEMLSSREVYEPVDATCSDLQAAEALATTLRGLPWPLFLTRLPADSWLVEALRRDATPRLRLTPAPGAPWLPLDPTWAEPEAHFSARRRADLARARRRAAQMGEVRYDLSAPDVAAVPTLLDAAFRIEAAGWKARAGTALLVDPARAAFYRRVATGAAARGALRLGFLRIGDRTAAMQLLVEHRRRYWLLKMGYDGAFARCSPGLLLMVEMVRCAARDGMTTFEFLGIDEQWLRPWSARVRPHVSVRLYPPGLAGRLARLAY